MHCPHYRRSAFRKIAEKDFIIQIIAMNIVQMNHIRFDFFYLAHEFSCRAAACKSVQIKEACHKHVPENVKFASDLNRVRSRRTRISSKCDIGLPAILHGELADILGDAPCGAGVDDGVDLEKFWHHSVDYIQHMRRRCSAHPRGWNFLGRTHKTGLVDY